MKVGKQNVMLTNFLTKDKICVNLVKNWKNKYNKCPPPPQ